MIFEQHYLDCLSQASYFIGDETTKRAVVVDPRRDVSAYLDTAREHGLTIELVIETHFHADFLSGHLELAATTGAEIAYGSVAETEFPSRKLADGENISLGEVELQIRHTPGHTPESISIVVSESGNEPYAVLTGDTLFVGDVGRPDLLSSIGVTSEELAADLYTSIHTQLLTLPDETRVYPAHGAGSSCGKNLSSETWSTIGEQRTSNYALAVPSQEAFIAAVTDGQTAPPAYFSFDAMRNREAHDVLDEEAPPPPMSIDEVLEAQANGAIVIDGRDPAEFAAGHIIGSLNVGMAGRFAEYCGAMVDPHVDVVLVTDPGGETLAKNRLARIGFDRVIGSLSDPFVAMAGQPNAVARGSRIDVAGAENALASIEDLQLLDVRQPGETADGVIGGARVIPLTRLTAELRKLNPARPTLVYCAGGFRSSIATSYMAANGFADVTDLLGGYGAWTAANRS